MTLFRLPTILKLELQVLNSFKCAFASDPDDTSDSVGGMTLAEAFARKKGTLAHKMEKRRVEQESKMAAETDKKATATGAAAGGGAQQQREMKSAVSNWKKNRAQQNASGEGGTRFHF